MHKIIAYIRKQQETGRNLNVVSDLINGDKYTEFMANLETGDNVENPVIWLNLVISADGARPINGRSMSSMWPCDAILAELEPKIRYNDHLKLLM